MIKTKIIYLFVTLCSGLSPFVTTSIALYEHVTTCTINNYWSGFGKATVNFTCGENDQYNYFKNLYLTSYFGKINFNLCRFRELNSKFLSDFTHLHTLNISNVELETLQLTTLRDGKNLRTLIASNNRLTEVSAHLFINAVQLSQVDLSNNTIKRIDPLAFEGAINISTLNMSHNQINQLDQHSIHVPSLLTLDLSNNNLTKVNNRAFDQLTGLKYLNLSNNRIGNLNLGLFAYLTNLEVLSLKCVNINAIQLGTFSHQQSLVSLDLSENQLKEFDFNVFLPVVRDLEFLFLNKNQLSELKSFRNEISPKLELLDIKNNNFNCSYLQHFMERVTWGKILLPVDPQTTNRQQSHIRGINCDNNGTFDISKGKLLEQSTQDHKELAFHKDTSQISNNTNSNEMFFIKCSLVSVSVCIVVLSFLIVFLFLKPKRISTNAQSHNVTFVQENSNDQNVNTENNVL